MWSRVTSLSLGFLTFSGCSNSISLTGMGAHEAMCSKSSAQCSTRAKCSLQVHCPHFSCSGKCLRLLHTHLFSSQPTLGVHVSRLCYTPGQINHSVP